MDEQTIDRLLDFVNKNQSLAESIYNDHCLDSKQRTLKEHGFVLTETQIHNLDRCIKYVIETELSDDDLDNICGGVLNSVNHFKDPQWWETSP
jgi:hypothetical protein